MKSERKVLFKDGLKITYYLEIRKVKNVTLKINEQGQLIVISNPYVPVEKIEDFVWEKVKWIVKKQQQIKERENRVYENALLQDSFYLFEKKLKIIRIQSNQNRIGYDDTNFYIYYIKEEDMHKTCINFIRKMCEKEFLPVVKKYYELMKDYRFMFPYVKYRSMSSRWGSCIPSKNQICLNTRLLHYPKAFMEYVVLHELVHFVEPNHSTSFYRVIEYYMPDYKERKKLIH